MTTIFGRFWAWKVFLEFWHTNLRNTINCFKMLRLARITCIRIHYFLFASYIVTYKNIITYIKQLSYKRQTFLYLE